MRTPAMLWPCVAIFLIVGLYATEKGAGYLILWVVPAGWLLASFVRTQHANVTKFVLDKLGFAERAARTPSRKSEAFIARSLTKKLEPVLANGGTLVLVGGDGYAIYANEPHPILRYRKRPYPWRRHVEQLLVNGCNIVQYIVSPTEAAMAAFGEHVSIHSRSLYDELRHIARPPSVALDSRGACAPRSDCRSQRHGGASELHHDVADRLDTVAFGYGYLCENQTGTRSLTLDRLLCNARCVRQSTPPAPPCRQNLWQPLGHDDCAKENTL